MVIDPPEIRPPAPEVLGRDTGTRSRPQKNLSWTHSGNSAALSVHTVTLSYKGWRLLISLTELSYYRKVAGVI